MHFRKTAQDKRLLNNLILTTVDYVVSIEEGIIDQETHGILMDAIESLPPKRKQVFKLCKLKGKSYEEVGEQLGISTETIRNQIVAANKSIKQYVLSHPDIAIMLITTCILSGVQK